MAISVFQNECYECNITFKAYVKGIPLAGVQYTALCPECETKNLLQDKATWIEKSIPYGAIELKEFRGK